MRHHARSLLLKGLNQGDFEVLVATDIAARGLDIAGVTHVINYDFPLHPKDGSGANFKKGRRADTGALGERELLACQIGPKFKLCTRTRVRPLVYCVQYRRWRKNPAYNPHWTKPLRGIR